MLHSIEKNNLNSKSNKVKIISIKIFSLEYDDGIPPSIRRVILLHTIPRMKMTVHRIVQKRLFTYIVRPMVEHDRLSTIVVVCRLKSKRILTSHHIGKLFI